MVVMAVVVGMVVAVVMTTGHLESEVRARGLRASVVGERREVLGRY